LRPPHFASLQTLMTPDKNQDQGNALPVSQVLLLVRPELEPIFHYLFQEGVLVDAKIGATVHSFLCDALGLDPQYVEERIQTVFLNGKAVDDPGSAVIPDHATIALSAAMPGLLGATLRKGSYYAGMRTEISHAGRGPVSLHEGKVLLKLFNLLPGEIGSFLLDRGVWLKGETLKKFLENRLPRLAEGCLRIEVDGGTVDVERLAQQQWPAGKEVLLRIHTAQ
jgi:hypothetical protein